MITDEGVVRPTNMSETQLIALLAASPLSPHRKAQLLQFVAGFMQGVHNLLSDGEFSQQMRIVNNPDFWQVGHNKVVEIVHATKED